MSAQTKKQAAQQVQQVQQAQQVTPTTVDFTGFSLAQIENIIKLANARRKELAPPKPKPSPEKQMRTKVSNDAMDELLGMNKVYDKISKWYNRETGVITTPKRAETLSGLGIGNKDRFDYLMDKQKNAVLMFSTKKTHITPKEFLEKMALVSTFEESKFSELLRHGQEARAKQKAGK